MSAGQKASIFQLRLNRLLISIRGEILVLITRNSAPLPYESSYIKLEKKMTSWITELRSMSKEMQGMQNRLEFEGARVRSLRSEYRYSQQQSVRDRQKHVKDSQDLLTVVMLELARLWEQLKPTDIDVINLFVKLIKSHLDKAHDLQELEQVLTKAQYKEVTTVIIEARSHMRPAGQMQPGPVDGITALILLLQVMQIILLSLTMGKKK